MYCLIQARHQVWLAQPGLTEASKMPFELTLLSQEWFLVLSQEAGQTYILYNSSSDAGMLKLLAQWVITTLPCAYKLQFQRRPHAVNLVKLPSLTIQPSHLMLAALLAKLVIKAEDPLLHPRGFYSVDFLVTGTGLEPT